MPSTKASPSSAHGDHSTSGCASHEGFGRLPTIVVGRRVCTAPGTAPPLAAVVAGLVTALT